MAQAFTRNPANNDEIIGFLDSVERAVVIEMLHQASQLIADGMDDADGASGREAHAESPQEDIFRRLTASLEPRDAPDDPALRRLLPDGVKDDDASAGEFRRLTEDALRRKKLENLRIAMGAFAQGLVTDESIDDQLRDAQGVIEADDSDAAAREVIMTIPQARSAMMALTDVRLVLAERLGIRTDDDAERITEAAENSQGPSNPHELMIAYYDFLTWLSESITLAVLRQV